MSFAARVTQKPTIEKRRTCTSCGRLGHLNVTCNNPAKFHDKIGIEIEGWWWDLPAAVEKARDICGTPGRRDGSIRDVSSCNGSDEDDPADFEDTDTQDCDEGCDDCPHPVTRRTAPQCVRGKRDCKSCGAKGWEFQTKPGAVGDALRQLTTLYPEVTSRAAGLHVHMSFLEKTSVTLLCSDGFFQYWKTRWEAWGTKHNVQGAFWERLRNENQYCRPNNLGTDYKAKDIIQNVQRDGRYKAINFQAFETHGTVEFRLLPMFQKGNLAVNAVETLVDIVETYLQTYQIDADIVSPATKFPTSKDEAVSMEPVHLDFDIPIRDYPTVTCELDLEASFTPGVNADGNIVMLRHEIPDYMSRGAADAQSKLASIADPKRNKVVWDTFNPNPEVRR
jgi:hypothetical protein